MKALIKVLGIFAVIGSIVCASEGSLVAQVNDPPIIDEFTIDPDPGTVGQGATIRIRAHDPDLPNTGLGTITCRIDYGDNSPEGERTITPGNFLPVTFQFGHTYAQAGTYPVTVTVIDTGGAETPQTIDYEVNAVVNLLPIIDDFTITPDPGTVGVSARMIITAHDPDYVPGTYQRLTFRINYGDGSPEEEATRNSRRTPPQMCF